MPKRMQYCPSCGLPHVTEWSKSVCLPCWKKEREYDLSKADLAFIDMQNEYQALAQQQAQGAPPPSSDRPGSNADLKRQIKVLVKKGQQQDRVISSLRSEVASLRRSRSTPSMGTLSQELIRTLITLCHPDKHGGNSEEASEATKQLLAMRKKR